MEDAIVAMLNALSEGPSGNTNDLLLSPASFNGALWQAAITLNNVAVKPISAVVLSIMVVIMLAATASRVEGDRDLGIRIIATTMFKAAIVIVVVQNAVYLLDGLNAIGTSIAGAANGIHLSNSGAAVKLGDQMRTEIKDAGVVKQLGLIMVLLIPWIIASVAGVLATVLIFIRFFQLYMLTAFASLPVAFFANEDTKPMAMGYLKRYGATVLSGVMIIIALKFYQALMSGWLANSVHFDPNQDVGEFVTNNFGAFVVAPIVFAFLLLGANSLAKALVGEG